MEQICKVDLVGVAGRVSETQVGDSRCVRMSVAVNESFGSVVNTYWFQVVFWPDKNDTRVFSKGQIIHAEGRMIAHYYTDKDGLTKCNYEIKAQKIW